MKYIIIVLLFVFGILFVKWLSVLHVKDSEATISAFYQNKAAIDSIVKYIQKNSTNEYPICEILTDDETTTIRKKTYQTKTKGIIEVININTDSIDSYIRDISSTRWDIKHRIIDTLLQFNTSGIIELFSIISMMKDHSILSISKEYSDGRVYFKNAKNSIVKIENISYKNFNTQAPNELQYICDNYYYFYCEDCE